MKSSLEQGITLSVVIPAFNEEQRISETLHELFAYFNQENKDFQLAEVIVIDDGSTDKTMEVVIDLKRQFPMICVIHFSQNLGKGAAVRAGVLRSCSDWILVADADQSTPWSEMNTLKKALLEQHADYAMGSRALIQSQVELHQAWWREGMGKIFNRIVRGLFGIPFRDTQCGFKLLRRKVSFIAEINQLKIQRFAWDVELILRLTGAGAKIIEVPVVWRNKQQSRVHPIKDSLEMLYQLFKLRAFLIFNALRKTE